MAEPLLSLDHVSKWYGPVLALNQVTLVLERGMTGLVGSNGSGKSTLIKLATGQIAPSLGSVRIRGIDAGDWRATREVGYCPDHDAFYEDMSGRQFVRQMAALCGYTMNEGRYRADAALERVGMADRCDRTIRGYSKGMRQRVKLAQALLHDPQLLILDEPLSGIDPLGRQEMLELFRALEAQGKCLLISSHELEELEKLTSHVAIMARGRIAAVGTVRQIRERLDSHPMSVRVVAEMPRLLARKLLEMEEVIAVDLAEEGVIVAQVSPPKLFFKHFTELVAEERIVVRLLEPLDESTHAVLGYLLGGSGKT